MLPDQFLASVTKTAKDYGLSDEETQVLVHKLKLGSRKNDPAIADEMGIPEPTFRYRMGKVYEKFRFKGGGTGKAFQLLLFLFNEYLKANPSSSLSSNAPEDDLASVVEAVRLQRYDKIQDQCGTLRMLNVTQQISLTSLYTDVYVLEEIPSQQCGDTADWMRSLNAEAIDPNRFERFGSLSQQQERIPGLDAVKRYRKLVVLGAPGSGKVIGGTGARHLLFLSPNVSRVFHSEMVC